MAGIPTKLWDLDPHSAAKHDILRKYMEGWLPIMAAHNSRIIFIDGFAGPGVYAGGEPGSPLVALDTCAQHVLKPQLKCSAGFLFIEGKKARADHLRGILATKHPPASLPAGWDYDVLDGNCADVLNSALDNIEKDGKLLAPTLAFLDPFGYRDVPMSLVKRIMAYPKCEVMVTFMAGFAHRFVGTGVHDAALRTLFGNDDWKGADALEGETARSEYLLDVYVKALKANGARYVRSFEMRDDKGRVCYYFVYATGHRKGMEIIKQAMWKVDPRGTFRFSDRTDHKQSSIASFSEPEDSWGPKAMQLVCDHFAGQTVAVEKVADWVWTETPYLFLKRPILAAAEKAGLITKVTGRNKAGTHPDGCVITFASKKARL